ncbi:MAG: zinc-binding dehydrogenase [Dehalococcoidia bacterium]|nr:zinc-binding dehydrogenase [Dehalococcoidia bacterium]
MKAIVFDEHGEIDKLRYTDVPEPVLGARDVMIKVRAAAANYTDIWARRGMPGVSIIMPHISGSDAAGEVVDIGSGVEGVSVGDEVMIHPGIGCQQCQYCANGEEFFCRNFKIWGFQTGPLDGGHAEYAKIPFSNVVYKPSNISWEEAASLPLILETVWRMLVVRARIRPGDTVLVWGAGGGLGTMAVQVCKLFNARAIAVASSDAKLSKASEMGAEFTINRSEQDVAQEVRRITERRGVDIVFEHVGQSTWPDSVRSLRYGGTVVVCGATTGFEANTDLRFLWNKQLNLLGSHMGSKADLMDALSFVERGLISPVVSEILPLKEVPKGQTLMEEDEAVGKIVYVP